MSEASSHKPATVVPSTIASGDQLQGDPFPAAGEKPSGSSPAMPKSSSSVVLALPVEDRTVISARSPMPDLVFHDRPPLETASEWEGEQLGQFVLQKLVGGGGMGIVFRALDVTLDREVAVKVLSRDQSSDEEALRRFRNEAQSAARLNHDNIARVFFVGEDRGVHYIVFEFIEGVNIRDLVLERGPLPLEQAISYSYQIARALEHASHRSVIHRDIKPSNVLITLDGQAKLVDMGLARLNQLAPATGDLTASGVTLGTFDYISPEQARDPRSADVRSDLYSLGCSLFFMLTGRPPFPEGTVLQKLLQHQADTPPDPRQLRPELPSEVTRILARLLAKNPAGRYQQPAELIDDLAALGNSLGMQLAAGNSPWVAPRPESRFVRWRHHLPWAVPIAALLMIVLGLDLYWSPRTSEGMAPAALVAPEIRLPSRDTTTKGNAAGALPRPPLPEVPPPDVSPPNDSDSPAANPPRSAAVPPISDFPGEFPELFGPKTWIDKLKELTAKAAAHTPDTREEPKGPDDLDFSLDPPDTAESTMPPVNAAVTGDHVLVVGDNVGPNAHASLHKALAAARPGDTVELRYDGRRYEPPINLVNARVRIRAGEGFDPIVAFRPEPQLIPLKYPPAMISLSGGQLTASNVHWELELPPNEPVDWSLFESRRGDLLQFQNCTFTIRGRPGYHSQAAFFDIKSPPGGQSMNMGGGMEAHVVNLQLQNCIARGEATFLRDNDLQAVRLTWDNGLLAISEHLLAATSSAVEPRHETRAQVSLRHVTAMVGGGLVLLSDSQDSPYQLLTEIRADDCILATSGRSALFEQRGPDTAERGLETAEREAPHFAWSGQRDYYHGFRVFGRIGGSMKPAQELSFADWQLLWADQATNQVNGTTAVVFRDLPGTDEPYHQHTPADYALDLDASENQARSGASDGSDAGSVSAYLPHLPTDESRLDAVDPAPAAIPGGEEASP